MATPTPTPDHLPLLVIFGASGRTGLPLLIKALPTLRVRAVVRATSKLPASLFSHPNLEVVTTDLAEVPACISALEGATYAVCVAGGKQLSAQNGLSKLVRAVLGAMPEKGLTRFLFQAGAFTAVPGERMPFGMRVMRVVFTAVSGRGGMARDADEAVRVLKGNESVQWIAVRPGRLVQRESKGLLKESPKPGGSVVYDDMATFILDLIKSDQNNHKCIYPAYGS